MNAVVGRLALPVIMALGALHCPTAGAQGKPVNAVYEARVAGLPIGRANITGEYSATGPFSVQVAARYRVLMWSGKLNSEAVGRLERGAVRESTYTASSDDSDGRSTRVVIERGTIKSVTTEPPAKTRGRVPITDEHKRDVMDPLSGMIVGALAAANSSAGPCAGRLPVFTGWSRFDLAFEPVAMQAGTDASPGRGGRTCMVLFTPVAGHKINDKRLASIAKARDMRIEFARPDANGLLLPSRIEVPLWIGKLVITRVS